MDKRYWHAIWRRIRPVRPWYFLLTACVLTCISVMGLRANNLRMGELRQAVYTADQNNHGIEKALQDLQVFVTAHMNTDVSTGPNAPYPPIQLQYTYDRAVQKAGEAATAANKKIYSDAQAYCERQDPVDFSGHNRVPCVQQYIENHGVALPDIPDSLYKFAFVSPWWSPDVAGWALLGALASFALFVGFWAFKRWVRMRSR